MATFQIHLANHHYHLGECIAKKNPGKGLKIFKSSGSEMRGVPSAWNMIDLHLFEGILSFFNQFSKSNLSICIISFCLRDFQRFFKVNTHPFKVVLFSPPKIGGKMDSM